MGQPLVPLGQRNVEDLLLRRYEYMRRDSKVAVTPPVTAGAVHEIYRVFQGDLRAARAG